MDEMVALFIGPQREQSGRPAGFGGGVLMAAGRYGEGNCWRRGSVDSMEKSNVVTRRFDSTPSRCGRGMDGGARRGNADRGDGGSVLSDEGDDPGLTNRVGPPVNEWEATAESDKRNRPDWEGGGGPRLGWKIREEAGPKPFLD
jgi:hypothetical protein